MLKNENVKLVWYCIEKKSVSLSKSLRDPLINHNVFNSDSYVDLIFGGYTEL